MKFEWKFKEKIMVVKLIEYIRRTCIISKIERNHHGTFRIGCPFPEQKDADK